MKRRQKLTAEQRKAAILRAAIPVFAEQGFHGATTKRLAEAAGVSEALLYRHFSSKEELYEAIGEHHFQEDEDHQELGSILALPPGTRRLVQSIQYLLVHQACLEGGAFPRIFLRSLLSDGTFAQRFLDRFRQQFFGFLAESLDVARQEGDLEPGCDSEDLGFWFVHHLGLGMRALGLPGQPVAPYSVGYREVVERSVRFALRGLGVRSTAIELHLDSSLWEVLKLVDGHGEGTVSETS